MAIIQFRKRRHTIRSAPLPIVGRVQPSAPTVPTAVPSLQIIINMMKALGLRKVEIRPDNSVGFDYCRDS